MKAITTRCIAAVLALLAWAIVLKGIAALAHVDAHPLPVITLAPVQVVATKPAAQRDVDYAAATIGQD